MIGRYWETVRYLRLEQVITRVKLRATSIARRSWPAATAALYHRRVARAHLRLPGRFLGLDRPAVVSALTVDEILALNVRGDALAAGRFEFINEIADLGWPPDWSAPGRSRLWRFHLHYFDDAIDLVLAGRRLLLLDLMEHWIRANPIHGGGDGWHPYTVSLRLVNWILALSLMSDTDMVPSAIYSSIAEHAIFLERNLEKDGGGNHLLKNLKAMTVAACCFQEPTGHAWRTEFGGRFVKELDRQLLSDGGHYERSPMYHCQVLGDAVEVATLVALRGQSYLARLLELIARMDRFLAGVTHPDGEVALFNDSAHGMAPSPAALHAAISNLTSTTMARMPPRWQALFTCGRESPILQPQPPDGRRLTVAQEIQRNAQASGYVTLPSGSSSRFLIADVGAVCPDDLPAHAHADLLSFEVSVDGKRMVVNSGVAEYAPGPKRDYYRSTRAHNTVVIDGAEQSDCWASFRVGRRAVPTAVAYREESNAKILSGEHTGFDHLGVRHRRSFIWRNEGFWIVRDIVWGDGEHCWWSYCHLHPDVRVLAEGASWIRIVRDGAVLDVCWYGFSAARIVQGQSDPPQGWYAERFGCPVPASVLILEGAGLVPARFGYALVPGLAPNSSAVELHSDPSGGIDVRIGEHTYYVPSSYR